MRQLLSDDGIRGVANRHVSPLLSFYVGRAFARYVVEAGGEPRIIVSRDTRISGPMLRSGLVAGIASAGVNVVDAIVLPTAGCAHLVRQTEAGGGVMITAGDRPAADNGFVLFDRHGWQLDGSQLQQLAASVDKLQRGDDDISWPTGGAIGRVMRYETGDQLYTDHVADTVDIDLTGTTIVVDCAHGAVGMVAPQLLRRFGARVVELNNEPDGLNINLNSGPAQLSPLQEAVVRHKAAAGFAYDGDGKRVAAVDETGQLLSALAILAVFAHRWLDDNVLPNRMLAVAGDRDSKLTQCVQQVGGQVTDAPSDTAGLIEAMIKAQAVLGGTSRGAIVLLDYATTADGLLATVQLLHIMQQTGIALSELAAVLPA